MSISEAPPATGTIPVLVIDHHADDGGWGTYSPHVPGVHGAGDTLADAVEDWRSAVAFARSDGWELRDVDVVTDDHDAVVFARIPA